MRAVDVAEPCEQSGIDLFSDSTEHVSAVATLAEEAYELLTIGRVSPIG